VLNIEKGRLAADFHAEFKDAGTDENIHRVLSLKSGDKANVVPGRASLVVEGLSEEIVRAAADETENETGVSFTVQAADNTLKIDVRGQAAHASTPQEGKNALTASLRFLSKLPLGKFEGHDALLALNRLFPYEDTCGRSVGVFREEQQSGAVTLCFSILNYTPESLTGTFDSRLPIGCTEENTKHPIIRKLAAEGIQMADVPMTKPHCVPGDSDFVKILLESYERYTGIKGEPLSTGGGTYVHNLERGVAFGCMTPEVDNHMHGDDEFMVIDTLLMSAKIFANAMIRICNELS
ncbi:MAG: peptidase dimerization domain-containing protein, partial [Lachnospiraceae bacterium]|nr:peptidase dimerization domain-containing protein [Lachnospiraceae bacterium]